MFALYQLVSWLLGPFIGLYLEYRKRIGKEDEHRLHERLGRPTKKRPECTLVWLHAASVGESLSVLPLVEELGQRYPDIKLLFTTGTVTSAKLVEERLPSFAFHQYVPVDSPTAVRRFLRHWQPNLALWVESELWPNLVCETSKYCPMLLLNGRISDDSYKWWQRFHGTSQYILSRFSLILPQSQLDMDRFEDLGGRQVKMLGNIKFDAPPLPSDPKKMGEIIQQVGDRPVWLASSTHSGEEAMIGFAHKEVKEEIPDLLTIIVPRHPRRAKEIAKELEDIGLKSTLRSEGKKVGEDKDIYIADTIGELGMFYRYVPIVFVGGSLVNRGGQNPLEPARLECAILVGPNMDNFLEIRREMQKHNAVVTVHDKYELKNQVADLLKQPQRQQELIAASMEVVHDMDGIIHHYIDEIAGFMGKIKPQANDENVT